MSQWLDCALAEPFLSFQAGTLAKQICRIEQIQSQQRKTAWK